MKWLWGGRSCSSCAAADAPVRGGGAALRRLRIQQTWGGQVDNSVLDEYQLARLCAACPRLESLAVAGAGAHSPQGMALAACNPSQHRSCIMTHAEEILHARVMVQAVPGGRQTLVLHLRMCRVPAMCRQKRQAGCKMQLWG